MLGRVIQIFKGFDDKIRSVKIRKGDGREQVHSIKHLYPLEIAGKDPPRVEQIDHVLSDAENTVASRDSDAESVNSVDQHC